MKDYKDISDETLVVLAKDKDNVAIEELLNRYKKPIIAIARNYYLSGGDREDLVQEASFALFKSIETYDEKSNVLFKTYAITCVKNKILSEIKKSNTDKNKPLNGYISLSDGDKFDLEKSDIALSLDEEPESNYINQETAKELRKKIQNSLSRLENEILSLYLLGYSYTDIAEKINKDSKSVDNAIQRIKKKIFKVIKK